MSHTKRMETSTLDYFKQKIYEIAGVPKSRLGSMENLANQNKKTVDELFGEVLDKEFIIQIGSLKIRFVYDPCILIDGWNNFSIHVDYKGYNRGNFHTAIRKKWPLIKIGFRNIYPNLYKGGGF